MAIKVNGQTVIDDSRQLTNIASLDATTVAAFGAAGVGGTNVSFNAAESISTRDMIVVNRDGEVETTRVAIGEPRVYNADHDVYTDSSRGCQLYLQADDVVAIGGFEAGGSGGKCMRFMRTNPDNTITMGNRFNVGSNAPSTGYSSFFNFTSDGEGNFAVVYGGYTGSVHPTYLRTFNLDSNLNVINVSSPYQLESDAYYDRGALSSYGTNKFIYVYHDGTTDESGLKYQTFSKNGSSLTTHTKATFLSTSGRGITCNLIGRTGATVNENQVVWTGTANSSFISGGGFSNPSGHNYGLLACVANISNDTITSFTSKTLGASTSYLFVDNAGNNTGTSNMFEMTSEGHIYGAQYYSAYQEGFIFQKPSLSSDNLTFTRKYNAEPPFAVDVPNSRELHSTTNGVDVKSSTTGNLLYNIPYTTSPNGDPDPARSFSCMQFWTKDSYFYFVEAPSSAGLFDHKVGFLGNTSGRLVGIATNSASVGQSVGLSVLGGVVDGYSGLETGVTYGLGSSNGSFEANPRSSLITAVSPTEMLTTGNSI